MSQLETLARLPHTGYNLNPHTHDSVTEWELCEAGHQAALDAESEAERYAENAWLRYAEGGWDPTGSYAAESLLTAGGLPALYDSQVW